MAVIWKFRLPMRSETSVEMPVGAHILSVQDQHGEIFIWAMMHQTDAMERRKFFIVGTGLNVPEAVGKYIATVQQPPYVWHIFEDPRT